MPAKTPEPEATLPLYDMPREVAADFIAMQAELPAIGKDKENPAFSKGGKPSKYVSLDAIFTACRPVANKHGFALSGRFTDDGNKMEAILIHKSGYVMSSGPMPLLVDKNNMQGLAGAITYSRRYGTSPLMGITPDEDDDGNAAAAAPPKGNPFKKEPPVPEDTPPPDDLPFISPEIIPRAKTPVALGKRMMDDMGPTRKPITAENQAEWVAVAEAAHEFTHKKTKTPKDEGGWSEADTGPVMDAINVIDTNEFVVKARVTASGKDAF